MEFPKRKPELLISKANSLKIGQKLIVNSKELDSILKFLYADASSDKRFMLTRSADANTGVLVSIWRIRSEVFDNEKQESST